MKNFNLYFWISTIFILFSFVDTTTTKITKRDSPECFSLSLGYPCCSENARTVYIDNDGSWGVENDHWCGIIRKNTIGCFSTALGYPCCSEFAPIEYTDKDGNWGIENDQWCGIVRKCDYQVGIYNEKRIVNDYLVKLMFSEDMSSVNIFDPEARVYIKPFEEKIQYFLEQYKKICDKPSEPYYDRFGEMRLFYADENYLYVSVYIPSYVAKRVELLPEVETISNDVLFNLASNKI